VLHRVVLLFGCADRLGASDVELALALNAAVGCRASVGTPLAGLALIPAYHK
jgi:hypothetical protein